MTDTGAAQSAEFDAPTVCIAHGRFIPCRKDGEHRYTANPYWVKSVRDYQGSTIAGLTWEPAWERDTAENDAPRAHVIGLTSDEWEWLMSEADKPVSEALRSAVERHRASLCFTCGCGVDSYEGPGKRWLSHAPQCAARVIPPGSPRG